VTIADAPGTVPCASCGEQGDGRYCQACGERRLDPQTMTVRHFLGDVVFHELTDFDSRIWRTARALVLRPGFLTIEYWKGRRRLYINPARLFLTAVVVYALATQGGLRSTLTLGGLTLTMAPIATSEGVSVEETLERLDRGGILKSMAAGRAEELAEDDERRDFHQRLAQFSQPLGFSNVLLLALALYAVFFWRYRLYAQHGVFAMHYMAFILLSTAIVSGGVLELFQAGYVATGIYINLGLTLAQLIYLIVAVRRFYFGHSRGRVGPALAATVAAFALWIANSWFTTVLQMAGAALALATT